MINTNYMKKCKETEILQNQLEHSYFLGRELNTITVNNGVFLSWKRPCSSTPLHGIGGVVDSSDNYVYESASIAYGDTKDRFIGTYEYDKNDIPFINETVVYLGLFHKQWGHFLVDFVPRLWFFLDNSFPYDIVYTTDQDEISGNYLELLNLLGIDNSRLHCIKNPTRFSTIIIPELSYISGGYYSDEFLMIFDRIKQNALSTIAYLPVYDKLYFSRKHLKNKKAFGESGIENAFAQNDYKLLYMEELSLKEQIYYVANAKSIAAISGTLCHNILFASKNTELIIINKTKKINGHQVIINQAMGNPVIYVDVYLEPYKKFPISYGMGPFWISNRSHELGCLFEDRKLNYHKDNIIMTMVDFLKYSYLCFFIKTKKTLKNILNRS